MQSSEKPKRRMVVYVTEETYARLQDIAEAESRSVSNVAEGKIILGLRAGPDRPEPDRVEAARTGQDRTGSDSEELKSSVIDVLDNLPVENLTHLAEKLSRILGRSLPVQTGQDQIMPVQSGITPGVIKVVKSPSITNVISKKKKQEIVSDVAVRLSEFIRENGYSRRTFKIKYGIDITNLQLWISGRRGMSLEMIDRFEKILSSGPGIV